MKEYKELDGEGTLSAPLFIVRWNGHEHGTLAKIRRPYDLLDMLTQELGIPEKKRECWLYEHGEDTWELEIGPASQNSMSVGKVHMNRIHGSTNHGRRRDILERIKQACAQHLRDEVLRSLYSHTQGRSEQLSPAERSRRQPRWRPSVTGNPSRKPRPKSAWTDGSRPTSCRRSRTESPPQSS